MIYEEEKQTIFCTRIPAYLPRKGQSHINRQNILSVSAPCLRGEEAPDRPFLECNKNKSIFKCICLSSPGSDELISDLKFRQHIFHRNLIPPDFIASQGAKATKGFFHRQEEFSPGKINWQGQHLHIVDDIVPLEETLCGLLVNGAFEKMEMPRCIVIHNLSVSCPSFCEFPTVRYPWDHLAVSIALNKHLL